MKGKRRMTRLSDNDVESKVALNENDIIIFLEKILCIKIKEIVLIKILKTDNGFYLYKYQLNLENGENRIVYLKAVKNDRIKESLFFYWCLLCEEEYAEKNIGCKINKVNIKQEEVNEYKRVVFLEIENNDTQFLKNGTRVYFIDILKYFKKEKMKVLNEMINNNCFLLLGIK